MLLFFRKLQQQSLCCYLSVNWEQKVSPWYPTAAAAISVSLLLCSSIAYTDDEIKFSFKIAQQKSLNSAMLILGSRIDGAEIPTAGLGQLHSRVQLSSPNWQWGHPCLGNTTLLSLVPSDRRQGNETKLCQGKFRLAQKGSSLGGCWCTKTGSPGKWLWHQTYWGSRSIWNMLLTIWFSFR